MLCRPSKKTAFEDIGGYDEETKFGEDSQLFQKLYNYNYHLLILTKTKYTFSLRRLRAEGVLETLIQYLRINANILLNGYHMKDIDYQMGGLAHDNKPLKPKYSQAFDPLISRLIKSSQEGNQKLQHILERIFYSDRY